MRIYGAWPVVSPMSSLPPSISIMSGPNTGSGRYSSGADTKCVNKVRVWYQVDFARPCADSLVVRCGRAMDGDLIIAAMDLNF